MVSRHEIGNWRGILRDCKILSINLPNHQVVSSSFLVQYRNNLKKTRELEELQEYYNAEKYEEIVNLLAEVISAS